MMRLETLAGDASVSLSECVRSILRERLERAGSADREEMVLAELLALRTILVNLLLTSAKKEATSAAELGLSSNEPMPESGRERARRWRSLGPHRRVATGCQSSPLEERTRRFDADVQRTLDSEPAAETAVDDPSGARCRHPVRALGRPLRNSI